jgi:methylated-DNA-[protein]-cysteine S-methyltransferase
MAALTFADRVRRVVSKIPAGRTMTYGEVARRAGNAKAARAVGMVMSRNRDPKKVPCHRVVAADGSMRGYSMGGVKVKAAMLARESRAARR